MNAISIWIIPKHFRISKPLTKPYLFILQISCEKLYLHPIQQSRIITKLLPPSQTDPADYSKFLFLFPLDIQNDFSFHHHDQTIAMCNSILHVVGDHQCGKVIAVYDHICDLQNFGRCFRVKGCGMLIQKQKLWFLKVAIRRVSASSLTTGEKTYLGSKTIFQSKTKNFQKLFVFARSAL